MCGVFAVLGGFALFQVYGHDASSRTHDEALLCISKIPLRNCILYFRPIMDFGLQSPVASKCVANLEASQNLSVKTASVNFTAGKRRERGASAGNANADTRSLATASILTGMCGVFAVLGGYALFQVHGHDASSRTHDEALMCISKIPLRNCILFN
jgi:hypothetical protein